MTKDREDRKKEKMEKKEKKERKEKKRREAEELEAREKKISKKHKSKSKEPEKPEKSKKKSQVEEKSPKKSKESKKKHKRSDELEEPETQIVDSLPVTVPIVTNNNDSVSDFEFDKEDIKHLLESYSKEEIINLIYKAAEKGSKLISAVFESADRESSQRNIFVRGLGWDTTHENLKAAFEVYGEIEECSVVMDKDTGRTKGYGFVLFKTRKGAREALRNPEKRMYNRTVSCNLAKPSGAGKAREPVESVKIDLSQSEMALPGIDLAHGLDKGHQQQQNMPMYAGQNLPFYQPPGFNPMYAAMMGNQAAMMGNQMVGGLPNYRMFGLGMMNQGPVMPPNHMGMVGQYDGNGNGVGGAGFDGERGWYLR